MPPWVVVPFACLLGLQVQLYLSLVPERFPNGPRCAHRPFAGTLRGYLPPTMTMCGLRQPLEVNRLRSNARREPLVR